MTTTFKLVLVPAADASVDAETQLHINSIASGLAIQHTGSKFCATHWLESEQAMWFGPTRNSMVKAVFDATQRWRKFVADACSKAPADRSVDEQRAIKLEIGGAL